MTDTLIQQILEGYWDNEGGIVLSTDGALLHMKRELSEMMEAQATTQQALETCQQELAVARSFIRDFSTTFRNYGIVHNMQAKAKELVASWDSKEADTGSEPLSGGFTGIASNIKKLVTKNHEEMAVMLINGNECVAFPRTWMQYRNVLESGKELQIVAQEDYSKGVLQMIIQHAELLYESESGK